MLTRKCSKVKRSSNVVEVKFCEISHRLEILRFQLGNMKNPRSSAGGGTMSGEMFQTNS